MLVNRIGYPRFHVCTFCNEEVSKSVDVLSPVNHRGLHQRCNAEELKCNAEELKCNAEEVKCPYAKTLTKTPMVLGIVWYANEILLHCR